MSKSISKHGRSRSERPKLPEQAGPEGSESTPRNLLHWRSRRTCERLGSALLTLILEKPIDELTVQEVLNRAAVGRSTFYVHYRDKDDLLLSQLEGFLEVMSTALSVRKEESQRVVPVAELFAHVGNQNRLYRALADSGRLHEFFDLAQGHLCPRN